MKKQFLIITAIIAAALFSCTKEKIETPPAATESFESISKPVIQLDPLSIGLDGWFKFNGNLADATGKLPNGTPNISGALTYTTDRKGNANSAIKFTGRYGIDITSIPYGTSKSVCAWVKYGATVAWPACRYLWKTNEPSPNIAQSENKYSAVISGDTSLAAVESNPLDGNWHFLVATYDGTTMNFYVDGSFAGSVVNAFTGVYPPGFTSTFHVGYFPVENSTQIIGTWYGSMDDVRFYNRVLSASEVNKLSHL